MARFLFEYLAICNNENLPNGMKNSDKVGSKFDKLNKHTTMPNTFNISLNFAKPGTNPVTLTPSYLSFSKQ